MALFKNRTERTGREMRESVFFYDLLALRAFSTSGAATDEDDPLPRHVQGRVDHHVDGLACLLEDMLLLPLCFDLHQLVLLATRGINTQTNHYFKGPIKKEVRDKQRCVLDTKRYG